jgi:hypothetical protein
MRIDGSTIWVFALLILGALFGFGCLFGGIALLVGAFWQDHKFKKEQDSELRQEQAMAVAVAEASISQDFNDRYHFYEAMYAEILHNSDTGPMPCV